MWRTEVKGLQCSIICCTLTAEPAKPTFCPQTCLKGDFFFLKKQLGLGLTPKQFWFQRVGVVSDVLITGSAPRVEKDAGVKTSGHFVQEHEPFYSCCSSRLHQPGSLPCPGGRALPPRQGAAVWGGGGGSDARSSSCAKSRRGRGTVVCPPPPLISAGPAGFAFPASAPFFLLSCLSLSQPHTLSQTHTHTHILISSTFSVKPH